MSFYNQTDYRSLLRGETAQLKKEHPSRTLKWLAQKTGIQATYLTNVLKERSHLNHDQLFALGEVLGWDQEQAGYAALLMDWERSSHGGRKSKLAKEVQEVRKAKLQSKAHLKQEVIAATHGEFNRFFLHPAYALVHAFMGIERYSARPALVARCLNLSIKRVREIVKELVDTHFLAETGKGYEKTKRNFHLPKESPLCDPHLALMQQAAAHHIQSLPDNEKYGFNATFSAQPEAKEKIHREFLAFLKKIEPIVRSSPPEELYGMRFDLFRWSYRRDEQD